MGTLFEAVIVDIDGTLADNDHRQHYLAGTKKNWPGFFSQMSDDKPRQNVGDVVRALWIMRLYRPIFVTGRGEEWREQTIAWLAKNFPWSDGMPLFMRKLGDRRPDYEIKEEIYKRDIQPKWDVKLVLDDRDSVVNMWRGIGLECWQVQNGAF